MVCSSPVPLPDLYFGSFSYPVADLLFQALGALINKFIYCLLSQSQTPFGKLQAFSWYGVI